MVGILAQARHVADRRQSSRRGELVGEQQSKLAALCLRDARNLNRQPIYSHRSQRVPPFTLESNRTYRILLINELERSPAAAASPSLSRDPQFSLAAAQAD